LRFVETFHADPGYIKALAQNVNDDWVKHGHPDHLVLSFHGLPRRTLDRGRPLPLPVSRDGALAHAGARPRVEAMDACLSVALGSGEWLKPYTFDVVKQLGRSSTRRVDVFCRGFVADCLETLEEIAIEAQGEVPEVRQARNFHLIPCLRRASSLDRGAGGTSVFRNLSRCGWSPPDHAERAA